MSKTVEVIRENVMRLSCSRHECTSKLNEIHIKYCKGLNLNQNIYKSEISYEFKPNSIHNGTKAYYCGLPKK